MAGKGAAKRRKKRMRRGATTPRVLFDIRLQTLPEALQTFEGLIARFNAGRIERQKFTALVYALNSYANFLRMAREEDFERRLTHLEKLIEERTNDTTKTA